MCESVCCFFKAQDDEGQSVCMCVREAEGEGGCQPGAAKCRVTRGVFETEKESLVVSEKELSGCKLTRCCCNSVVVYVCVCVGVGVEPGVCPYVPVD